MPSPSPSRASLQWRGRAGVRTVAVALAVLAVLVMVAWHAGAAEVSPRAGDWLAMALFGIACGAGGFAWAEARQAPRLHEARTRARLATHLADAWWFETDAHHCVHTWRPPLNAPTALADARGHLPLGDGSGAFLHRFFSGASLDANLRAALDAHAPLDHVCLACEGEHAGEPWLLRAQPRFDARGRFAGHLGTAVPLAAARSAAFSQAVLDAIWAHLPVPAVALRRFGSAAGAGAQQALNAGGWQVVSLTPEAERLPKGARNPPPSDWTAWCAQLPAPLAAALAPLEPGSIDDAGGWTVQVHAVAIDGEPDGGRLVLLTRKASEDAVDPTALEEQASFAYSVSHDLRAPIRVVEGFARILKEDYGRFLDRIGNDHLERVLAAAARMNSMIDALLALSRLQTQPLSRKPVDLSELAAFILEDLRRDHPERAVELTIEPNMQVVGDPTLLRIALENLLGNAWKYSSQVPLARIEFRHVEHDGQRVLMVADNGAGFDMRFADRLFGVFQRLHSSNDFQGTGVGLASVRRIIRRHGGDIWARAEVGQGARFYFTLEPTHALAHA